MITNDFFASRSVPVHLLRGVLGLVLLVGSFVLTARYGPVALLIAPLGVLALRGCPTCWALGLAQTIANRRGHSAANPS